MIRFAANLTWLFREHGFADRFDAAAQAGFTRVECNFPTALPPDAVAKALARNGQRMVLFNASPGDFADGDRGLAALPERRAEFAASIATALDYAAATDTKLLHVMAGIGGDAATYRDNLLRASDAAQHAGVTIVIEPINGRDMPGYFLCDFAQGASIVSELDRPNLKLLFDIYHHHMLHGSATERLTALLPITAHVQIAAAPDRTEPGSGDADDKGALQHLESLGYDGVVGLEYRPVSGTAAGLSWMKNFSA